MQIIYQGRIYVRDRDDNKVKYNDYVCMASTQHTYSHDRAQELLAELLASDWWARDYVKNPVGDLRYAIVTDVYDVAVEPL